MKFFKDFITNEDGAKLGIDSGDSTDQKMVELQAQNEEAERKESEKQFNEQIKSQQQALDTVGFVHFFARAQWVGDSLGDIEKAFQIPPEYNDSILQAFEAFQQKDALVRELKSIVVSEAGRFTGISPDGAELAKKLDVSLTEIAETNPEELRRISQSIYTYKEQNALVKTKEQELLSRGSKLEQVNKELNFLTDPSIRKLQNTKILFNKKLLVKNDQERANVIEQRYGSVKNIETTIEKLQEQKKTLEDIPGVKQEAHQKIHEVRQEILDDLGPVKDVMNELRQKSVDQMMAKLQDDKVGLNDVLQVQKSFDQQNAGGDVFWKDQSSDELQEQIDIASREHIKIEVEKVITALANNPQTARISPVLQSLSKYVDLQTIGSQKGDQAKELVISVIDEVLKKSTDKTQQALLTAASAYFKNRHATT